MKNYQEKRFINITNKILKVNKKISKESKKCIQNSCENMPSDKILKKMKKEYEKELNKECDEKDKDYFICSRNFYDKSEIKKITDYTKECREKHCSYYTNKMRINTSNIILENNKDRLNRYNLLKEYLESNDTSSKNKSKYIKRGKFLDKKEFDFLLKENENNIEKINNHIKIIKNNMNEMTNLIIKLEKELINKSSKKSIKKSRKKSTKKSRKNSKKTSRKNSNKKSSEKSGEK